MAEIVIEFPDGAKRYPLPESVTHRESKRIKTVTGLRMGELADGLETGDPDVLIAFAIVAAERQGERLDVEALYDLDIGTIRLDGDEDTEEDPTLADAADVAPAVHPNQTTILDEAGAPEFSGSTD